VARTGDRFSSAHRASALVDGKPPRGNIPNGGDDCLYAPRFDGYHHDIAHGFAGICSAF
jgi:hypothetical protein